jgi:hypothetical protein
LSQLAAQCVRAVSLPASAAAIANAHIQGYGSRIRDLPTTLDKLVRKQLMEVKMRHVMALLATSIIIPVTAVLATGALAKDRPVTDQERPKLEAALKEAGCSSGKMEFDDDKAAAHPNGKFEVDDATCQDGKKYDLTFDPNFKVLTKKLD